jgi:hypothetical protein
MTKKVFRKIRMNASHGVAHSKLTFMQDLLRKSSSQEKFALRCIHHETIC